MREPMSTVRRILHQPVHDLGEFRLPPRANRLTSKERQTVVSVVDVILAAHDRSDRKQDKPGLRAVARKRGDSKRGKS